MNEYGLDAEYFAEKLKLILRDISRYTPAEMARELARMSVTADESVLGEDEFKQGGWISVKDKLPENNSGLFLCSGHEKTLFVCHRKHHEWFRSPQLQRVVGISHWMQIKPPEAE
jgi:hypothetical protein